MCARVISIQHSQRQTNQYVHISSTHTHSANMDAARAFTHSAHSHTHTQPPPHTRAPLTGLHSASRSRASRASRDRVPRFRTPLSSCLAVGVYQTKFLFQLAKHSRTQIRTHAHAHTVDAPAYVVINLLCTLVGQRCIDVPC